MKRKSKQFISAILALCMLTTVVSSPVFADNAEGDIKSTIEESLNTQDPSLAEQFPGGFISMPQVASEIDENAGEPLKLYIVRYGGTEGEARVNLKFSDYTAQYGKDYCAEVRNSLFSRDKIEANENSKPVMYMFSEDTDLTQEDATYDDLIDQYGEDGVGRMTELMDKYIDAVAETEAQASQTDPQEASDENNSEPAASGEAEPTAKPDAEFTPEPIEQSAGAAEDTSPLYKLNEQVSQYTGTDMTAQEFMSDEQINPEMAQLANELMGEAFPGTETEVVFEEGENLKEIIIYPTDDGESNGDRVFVAVLNGGSENITIDQKNNTKVTIKDDEEYISPYIYIDMSAAPSSVAETETGFQATLHRDTGLYQTSTLVFTAATDKGSVLIQGNVIFMPGVDKQTIDIPLDKIKDDGSEEIYLSLSNAVGCDISEDSRSTVNIIRAGDGDSVTLASSSTGKEISADDSMNPFNVDGEEFYDHFVFKMDENTFDKTYKGGPCGSVSAGWNSGGYYKLDVPDHWCACNGGYIGAKQYLSYGIMPPIESVDITWGRGDYNSSACNRAFISFDGFSDHFTDNSSSYSHINTVAFVGDLNSNTTTNINLRTGNITNGGSTHDYSKSNFIKSGGYYRYYSFIPDCIIVQALKTSGGINGMHMEINGIRFNYMEVPFKMENPDSVNGVVPGTLEMVSRDNKQQGTDMKYYGREKVTLAEASKNDKYELVDIQYRLEDVKFSMEHEKNYYWRSVGSKTFDAVSKTLDLSQFWSKLSTDIAEEIRNVYPSANNDLGTIHFKPIYKAKEVKVTLKSDEHGGVKLTKNANKKEYTVGKSEADKTVTLFAGDSITIEPYDIDLNYEFAGWGGSSSPIGQSSAANQIPFSLTDEKSSITLEAKDYTMYPKYSAHGTFVELNKGDAVSDISVPVDKIISDLGDVKAGDFVTIDLRNYLDPDIYHSISTKHVPTWSIETENHPWRGKNIGGWTLYYEVLSGANSIKLSFENTDANAVPAVNGKILKYNSSILNPPVLSPAGSPVDGYAPAEGAQIIAGGFIGRAKADGSYVLDWTEAEETAAINHSYPLMFSGGNEYITAMILSGNLPTLALLKPQKADGRVNDIVVDFYGDEDMPQPTDFFVLTGEKDAIPTAASRIGQINMADGTVGFRLKVHDSNKSLNRVVFRIYDKEMSLRNEYAVNVQPQTYDYVVDLTSIPVETEDGTVTQMPLNGLLNFHDGDRVFVDLRAVEASGVETSFGEYDSGVVFHEVPGQGIDTYIPDIMPDNSALPNLPIIGNMNPRISAGPLTVQAFISGSTMEYNVGFNVGLMNKVLKEQNKGRLPDEDDPDDPDDPTPTLSPEEQEYKDRLDAADKKRTEAKERMEQLASEDLTSPELKQAADDYAQADKEYFEILAEDTVIEPMTGGNTQEIIEKPTAQQMQNPLAVAKNSAQNFGRQVKDADKVIKMLQEAAKDKESGVAKARDALARNKGGISMNMSITFGITVRMVIANVGGTGTWVFDSACAYGQLGFGIAGVFYTTFPSVPIPVYAGFAFSSSLGLYNGMQAKQTVTMDDMQGTSPDGLYYKGNVPVALGIEVFLGAGIRNLLSLEVGMGFLQQFNFAWGEGQKGTGVTTFYAYTQISLVIFSGKWKFAQVTWPYTLYVTPASAMSLMSEAFEDFNPAISEMEVDGKEYKNQFYTPASDGVQLMSDLGYCSGYTLVEDSADMKTQVVPLGEGKYLMAFEGIDSSRDKYNRAAIYYSIYNGSDWSTPQILQNDGTIDAGLTIDDFGDKIMISWTSADRVFTEDEFTVLESETDNNEEIKISGDAVLKVLSALDVYSVVIDKSAAESGISETAITRVTDDTENSSDTNWGYAHEKPHAVRLEDGRIILFYTTLDYNEYGGGKISTLSELLSVPGVIMYRIFENGQWSEEYYQNENPVYAAADGDWYGQRILDVNLTSADGETTYYPLSGQFDVISVNYEGENKILAAYIVDGDNNLQTGNDRTLFMSVMTPSRDGMITSAPIALSDMGAVSNPTFAESKTELFGDVNLLTWSQGGELMYFNIDKLFGEYELGDEEADIQQAEAAMLEKSELTLPNGRVIPSYKLKDGAHASVAIRDTKNPETGEGGLMHGNGFTVVNGEDGNVYVLWTQSTGEEQILNISALALQPNDDGTYNEVWRTPKDLSLKDEDDESREYDENPAACVDENGSMVVLYNSFDMIAETGIDADGDEVMTGKVRSNNNLCAAHFAAIDSISFAEDSIKLSNDYPKANTTFTVQAEVENTGLLASNGVSATAEVIETIDGAETVIQTVDASTDTMLLAGGITTISAELNMTQEMIDKALINGASYKAVFTANEPEFGNLHTVEVPIKVGAKLDIDEIEVRGSRSHDISRGDDGNIIRGDVNGSIFAINAVVTNNGNVTASDLKFDLDVENKNAYNDSTEPDYETATDDEIKEYIENMPQNASVINNPLFNPYIDLGIFMLSGTKQVEIGETTSVRMVSLPVSDSLFSENGTAGFVLSAYDGELNTDPDKLNIQGFKTFSQAIPEEDVPLKLAIRQDGAEIDTLKVTSGNVTELEAFILPLEAASNSTVTWSSSDENVAAVGTNGDITGVNPGTATVTAVVDGTELTDSVTVTVTSGNSGSSGGRGNSNLSTSATNTPAPSAEPSEKPANELLFTDVNTDDWFYDSVKYVYENGLMNGTEATLFEPDTAMTRGMMVTILGRADGIDTNIEFENVFTDVNPDEYYAPYIAWAAANGIVEGNGDGTFSPDDSITREQMAAIMYRYAKSKDYNTEINGELKYSDNADISDYAKDAVIWSLNNGIMHGNDDNTFAPQANTTRAEAAAVFERFNKSDFIKRDAE